jgi:tRNA pseudouridine55 synthase
MGEVSGLLAVDKPTGLVSKDVSRWLVKRLGRLHIGHVGTLDPAASGVLPILLGRATRLQDHLLNLPKTYEFDITFGSETDTLDRDGTVRREAPWDHITEGGLVAAMKTFLGDIEQTPPMYSAVKYKGKPLYDYARSNQDEAVPLEALKRKVRVSDFDLLSYGKGVGSFRLTCSKGTYVRSLVKDVSEKVGSCGTLTRLVRTQAAGVRLGDAYSLETIEARLDTVRELVVPMEQIELDVPRWRASRPEVTARLATGQQAVIDLAEYEGGVTASPGTDASVTGWARSVFLIKDSGEALGLGAVRRVESGRVAVVMKRGL